MIRYLITVKSGITYIISHNHEKIEVDSYDFLPLEKIITSYNVIIFVTPVFNKDKSNFYYNMFLEEASYELPKKLSYKT